jgi:hypothetical protein
MNKLLLTLTLFFIVPISLFAQSKAINGKVTDENGAPIPNVNVIEKKIEKRHTNG